MFESCRAQLSTQQHYDFGLRALKSVLASSGIIRRDFKAPDAELSEGDEENIVKEAFKGSILPKLLKDDAVLFLEVLARVFALSSYGSYSDSKFTDALTLSRCDLVSGGLIRIRYDVSFYPGFTLNHLPLIMQPH